MLNWAVTLDDLRVPPANRLEKLRGDRAGQYSIRINERWRICFEWQDGDAHNVGIVDDHEERVIMALACTISTVRSIQLRQIRSGRRPTSRYSRCGYRECFERRFSFAVDSVVVEHAVSAVMPLSSDLSFGGCSLRARLRLTLRPVGHTSKQFDYGVQGPNKIFFRESHLVEVEMKL